MNLPVWRGGGRGVAAHLQVVVGALILLLVASSASGQTVYRWEDERGVVHFSDSPPPNAKNVERRSMPRAPKPAIRGTEGPTVETSDDAKQVDGDKSETPTGEPARVEIKKQDVSPVGDATSEFFGEVENVGGSPANGVVAIIEVTETNQGAECFREEVDVSPSSLGPGEKGTYSVTMSNPCLYGPIATTVRLEWD